MSGNEVGEASEQPERAELVLQFAIVDTIGEMVEITAPHQRALLSILAVAERYQIDPVPLLKALAVELRGFDRLSVTELADKIGSGACVVDALDGTPNVLPVYCVLALRLARDDGNLSKLYSAWLERQPEDEVDAFSRDEQPVSMIMRTAAYTFAVCVMLVFLCTRIVPEFQKMYEEFGIDLPAVMTQFIKICDVTAKFWFVPIFIFVGLFVVAFPIFRNYLRQFRPAKWRQRVPSQEVNQKRSLALITRTQVSTKSILETITSYESLDRLFPQLRKTDRKLGQEMGQWEQLATSGVITSGEAESLALASHGETQAWLLSRTASDNQTRQSTRKSILIRCTLALIHIGLVYIVALACVAVFMTYINIAASLN